MYSTLNDCYMLIPLLGGFLYSTRAASLYCEPDLNSYKLVGYILWPHQLALSNFDQEVSTRFKLWGLSDDSSKFCQCVAIVQINSLTQSHSCQIVMIRSCRQCILYRVPVSGNIILFCVLSQPHMCICNFRPTIWSDALGFRIIVWCSLPG